MDVCCDCRPKYQTIRLHAEANLNYCSNLNATLCANAQQSLYSLLLQLHVRQNDMSRVIRLRSIARPYGEINPDSAYYFSEESLKLALKLALAIDEAGVFNEVGYAFAEEFKIVLLGNNRISKS